MKQWPHRLKKKIRREFNWSARSQQFNRYSKDYLAFANFDFPVGWAAHKEIFGDLGGWRDYSIEKKPKTKRALPAPGAPKKKIAQRAKRATARKNKATRIGAKLNEASR